MSTTPVSMQPQRGLVTLRDNKRQITTLLDELVLQPRLNAIKWAEITKQTPNIKIGYPGQHLASLITGMKGERTGARGKDLVDGSEVKSCSRIDQLDKCLKCGAAVARIESQCPECDSKNIKRNNDSKWLIGVRSEDELDLLLNKVPRFVFIIGDYCNFDSGDFESLRIQAFEIWPQHPRHKHFRTLLENYYHNIYLEHIKVAPTKTPAPKNFWPYSYQFYMCNPIPTFRCTISKANSRPSTTFEYYVEPEMDRSRLDSPSMPYDLLSPVEKLLLANQRPVANFGQDGVSEQCRSILSLRDTDKATPQKAKYERGVRRI